MTPRSEATVAREAFISAYVDLRAAAIRSPEHVVTPTERAEILGRHDLTEEKLMEYVQINGTDVALMRSVWDEVETRLDQTRVLPTPDSIG